MISARELECRRRRRERREELARLEREWVCGGPLVDLGETVLSGGDAMTHWQHVQRVMAERIARSQRESEALVYWFIERCNLRLVERAAAQDEMLHLIRSIPRSWYTEGSTSEAVPGPTIPRFPLPTKGPTTVGR